MFSALLTFTASDANIETRTLRFHNLHTNEDATIVFKRNGQYDPAGLSQINHILRDWRKNKVIEMNPKLLDLIWEVYQESGSNAPIQIICGFRAPETNEMLRRRSSGVAENSQHMRGNALDFFLPDVPLAKLREIGLRLQVGGVGFYPTSGSPFVHLDVGSVRHWPRMTRQQLVRVFPEGHTLHVPSDGKPLPGYDAALASYRATGSGAAGGNRTLSPAGGGGGGNGGGGLLASLFNRNSGPAPAPQAQPAPPQPQVQAPVALAAVAELPMAPLPRPAPARPAAAQPAPVELAAASVPAADAAAVTGLIAQAEVAQAEIAIDVPLPRPVPAGLRQIVVAAAAPPAPGAALKDAAPVPPADIPAAAPMQAAPAVQVASAAPGAFDARFDGEAAAEPQELAFAAAAAPVPPARPDPLRILSGDDDGAPLPAPAPRRQASRPVAPDAAAPDFAQAAYEPWHDPQAVLTYTAVENGGWSFWTAVASTRQEHFAELTTSPSARAPGQLFDKPERSYAAGFGPAIYQGLRTDRFAGPLVAPVVTVSLDQRRPTRVAAR